MSIILRMSASLAVLIVTFAIAWIVQIYPLMMLPLFAVPAYYDFARWMKKRARQRSPHNS